MGFRWMFSSWIVRLNQRCSALRAKTTSHASCNRRHQRDASKGTLPHLTASTNPSLDSLVAAAALRSSDALLRTVASYLFSFLSLNCRNHVGRGNERRASFAEPRGLSPLSCLQDCLGHAGKTWLHDSQKHERNDACRICSQIWRISQSRSTHHSRCKSCNGATGFDII